MGKGWVGVDLDGTLAEHEVGTWKGETYIGTPIWPMVNRVHKWLQEGYNVKILTARARSKVAITAIQDWLEKECQLPRLEVTDRKDYSMFLLYDDRAVRVEFNTGRIIGEDPLGDD